MSEPRIGSLFSGYGGLDMGVMAALGGSVAWHVEFDKAPSKILAHHWPDVPNYGDVTAVDWSAVEPVDIITGGSPCQDLSHAGKRQGMTEGTRSNLWVAMREAIAQLRPGLVVWENVRGAYSAAADSEMESCAGCLGGAGDGEPSLRALGRVLGDLSDLGYDCRWHGLRAADVGAPHGRFRVFVVAHSASERWAGPVIARANVEQDRPESAHRRSPGGIGLTLMPTPRATDGTKGGPNQRGSSGDLMLPSAVSLLPTPMAQEPGGTAEQYRARWLKSDGRDSTFLPLSMAVQETAQWGIYADAITRWETLTRPAPAPTQPSKKGTSQLSPAFSEWLMGLPAGHVTDVPGLSRNDMLKALGNGVVPHQAAAALRFLLGVREVAA